MTRKMNKPVNVLLGLLVALLISNSIYAQQQRQGQQGPPPVPSDEQIEQMLTDLSKALSLSDEQEKVVSDKVFAHFELVKEKTDGKRPGRQEMEKEKAAFEKDVKSVLTEEQKDLYDDFMKEQKKHRHQGKNG